MKMFNCNSSAHPIINNNNDKNSKEQTSPFDLIPDQRLCLPLPLIKAHHMKGLHQSCWKTPMRTKQMLKAEGKFGLQCLAQGHFDSGEASRASAEAEVSVKWSPLTFRAPG